MRTLKHLPLDQWPEVDRKAFEVAYAPGDIFDETNGPGAHLADGTRRFIKTTYRRWLGFLHEHHRLDLQLPPAERITPARVRTFIEQISSEVRATTLATSVGGLYYAGRLIAPNEDWEWLGAIRSRLAARAKSMDRFNQLVPARQTLDLGIEMMDQAIDPSGVRRKRHDLQYRDGLLLALLSVWPIRRRSIAAMTIFRHVQMDEDGVNLLLYSEDTKAKFPEHFRVPAQLAPYFKRYLRKIRPRLSEVTGHDGFWASNKRCPLSESGIAAIVRRHTANAFGKAMGLHDFRRAAGTYLAMDAPDKVGLIPGVLQHTGPEVSEKHYILARSIEASRRHTATIVRIRADIAHRSRARGG